VRVARRLTQEKLAEQAGLSPSGVSLLERGRQLPRFETVGRLADALGLTLAERVIFEASVEASDSESGSGTDIDAQASTDSLPRELSLFFGREREVAEVRRLLREYRLVTLTGAGGVGKTRLAVEVAQEMTKRVRRGR
jgi:transcriptional regulator with XRE-family HTH domain